MKKIISKSQIEKISSIIKCGDAKGSAFYINQSTILTARHNVIDAININASIEIGSQSYPAESILVENAELDICLIKVESLDITPASLVITQLFFEQDCNIYGFPSLRDNCGEHLNGKINALPKDMPYDIRVKVDGIEDYDYSGLSGAPVFTAGKLIGMARIQIDNEIGIVSFAKAKEFLRLNTIEVIEDEEIRSIPKEIEDSAETSVHNYKTSNKLNKAIKHAHSWLLISGSPGSGKTTFTANFLPDDKEILVCGKYFIKIPNYKEAIQVRTSVRSIVTWLEISISKIMSNNIDSLDKLEDRINRVSSLLATLSFSGISKQYLFFIDGLDEVKNIDSFLGIFPIKIPENIQVILSCTNKDILPSAIKNRIVNDNEINIDPLELGKCESYIRKKLKRKGVKNEIIQKLAIKSEGHPLYLNYLINSLKSIQISNDELEDWIDKNPNIEGDIERYYLSIWDSFFRSKEKLLLITTISQFRNPVDQRLLINCLPEQYKLSFYSEYPQIKYLTNETDDIELYHGSFKIFINKKVPEILPSINDNIFDYCDSNRNEIYSIENWLFHKQKSTKPQNSIESCNQKWADDLCLNHVNPELVIQDIKMSISLAVEFRLVSEVIRILLLLQRVEFRYDSLFAENSYELCKSMISMGEFTASLRYLVREGNLLVSDYDALYFLQLYYENNAIVEGDKLLEVLEGRFRLYLENEFKNPEGGFSLNPFQIMMQAFALSIHSKKREAILNCLNLTEDLKRFQDAAKRDNNMEASNAFLNTRAIGSAWLNAYTMRCYDSYLSLDQVKKMSNQPLDETWIQLTALTIIFYNDFDNYDSVRYENAENYINLINDLEWLIDNQGIADDIYLQKIILRALIYDSRRTDIIETLISNILKLEEVNEGVIKNKNGVDVNFEKIVTEEFIFLCKGFKQTEKAFDKLENSSSNWENYFYSLFKQVNLLEGKILRVKNHSCEYKLIDCRNHLDNLINSIDFGLWERAYWDRSYLIPEDFLPIIFSKITSLYLLHFPDRLQYYIDFLKSRCNDQFGLYNEGYRATLIKIIEQFIYFDIDKNETLYLIDTLSDFVIQNIENRWERTPELLLINQFYSLINEREKAQNLFIETMCTSMGPSWYKESQFSILNTAFSLSDERKSIIDCASKVAYLLNEASGEMTFQRYVRHSKERFIGLLSRKGEYKKAIELLKFEIIPPYSAIVEGAEFYHFDIIESGRGYSYGAKNIAIESGILHLIENIETEKPELKIALGYIFCLHNEVFRHINDFGEIMGSNLSLLNNSDKKLVVFNWVNELVNSSNIKGEESKFIRAINSKLSNPLKKEFNAWADEEKVEINFEVIGSKPTEHERNNREGEKRSNNFEKFNKKYLKDSFESDSIIIEEAIQTFIKEKISIWSSRNWSTSSSITSSHLKESIKNSSQLLKAFEYFLQNIDEEAWDVANELIWYGNEIFTIEEAKSIQQNILNHVELIVHRKNTMKDRYSWLLSEENIEDCADNEVFKLLIWLMEFPDRQIKMRANSVVRELIQIDEEFITIAIKEMGNYSSNLRIKLFELILETSQTKPRKIGDAFSLMDLKAIVNSSDLISSKFLKDIGDVLKSYDIDDLSNHITTKFNIEETEGKDVYFEDERFDCIDFILEELIENKYINPIVCQNLEKTKENGFSIEDIEILKKSNKYLRQSFRESVGYEDYYYNTAINILNKAIMPLVNLKNMDSIYDVINE